MTTARDATQMVEDVCAEVGVVLQSLRKDVQERLVLLAEHTETIGDGRRIARLARAIFAHYERRCPERAFDDLEQRVVLVGGLFADIGKTGPPHATASQQRLIVEMFSVEGVRDDKQPVSRFFSVYFPRDASERLLAFAALGLDPEMSMRSFWNLHAGWTLDIARDSGLPDEAVAAAATHHLLEDVNPDDIVAEDGRFSESFGENHAFDRAEKLVILLDKYDALLRRGRRTHDEAMRWLGQLVGRHPKFSGDDELTELIGQLDRVGRREAV